jgi:hypothetical protein
VQPRERNECRAERRHVRRLKERRETAKILPHRRRDSEHEQHDSERQTNREQAPADE